MADEALNATDCRDRQVTRRWPFAEVTLQDPRLAGVQVHLRTFVPNAYDDAFIGTVPVAMAEIRLRNDTATPQDCQVHFDAAEFLGKNFREIGDDFTQGLAAEKNFVAWVLPLPVAQNGTTTTAKVTLSPGDSQTVRFMIGHWESNWPSSARLSDPQELATYVARFWETLASATERLSTRLPATSDEQLNEYLRWYTSAGVAMTRVLKDGTALTMGYHELNQRDSFWTTWVHLVLWPTLERRMIEESVWGQRPDGKVPTTILPLIEREDDVDINCYFILRGLRYVRFYHDDEFGRKIMPTLVSAAKWLAGRDQAGSGLPQGASFWYDWKDVSGVEQRTYSPHASMLYVAALRQLADYAQRLGETSTASDLRALSDRGNELLQEPTAAGGLWGGESYQEVWEEGAVAEPSRSVLQDQVVGVLFGVVDNERANRLLTALRPNATTWGVRETFPYRGDGFGYGGGDYHNGGIWPWLNHVHAWALLRQGRKDEAVDLLKKVARADLELDGDFIPHEYLHGQTGKQSGVPMQGWNAAMFGTVYFGLSDDPQRKFPLQADSYE